MNAELDRVLLGLQGVRRRSNGWMALCPGHDDQNPSLSINITKDGTILLKCFAGCEQGHVIERVCATVGISPGDLFPPANGVHQSYGHSSTTSGNGTTRRPPPPWPGLTLAQYATAKMLDAAQLKDWGLSDAPYAGKPAVRISYRDETGKEAAARFRVGMEKGDDWDRFKWQKGASVSLYGRDRLALARERGSVVLPEGESDAHTFWHHDEPALGIPGADNWRELRDAPLLADIPTIYVPLEPDQGGQALRQQLLTSAIAPRVRVVDLSPYGVKDVSALHCIDPDLFAERWQAAKDASVPLGDDAGADVADESFQAGALPAYPTDAFPPIARRFIQEAAAALGAPEVMIGLPLTGFAAAAIGNTRFLEIKRGYRQRGILWGAIVGPPGSVKTPSLDAARAPLAMLQRAAKTTWDEAMARFERDLADWNELDKTNRALVAKPTPPRLEHFITTDSTKEALTVMAAESAGLAVYRDELAAWVAGFDAYRSGRGGDRQDMLSLWSGTPQKIDRKGAPPIVADHPTVSVVGGVQPDRLNLISAEAGQDGFLDRFLWAYPDVPAMRWTDAEISEESERAICGLFMKLRAPLDVDHADGFLIRPSREARNLFVSWYDENAALQEGASPLLRGVYAKLPAQLLRIALVLHCLAQPSSADSELSPETMENAMALVEFHRAHAARVMAHFHHGDRVHYAGLQTRIVRILRILPMEKKNVTDAWTTRSELLHRLGNVKTDELTAALESLHKAGAVEHRTRKATTKSVEEWRLSPHSDSSTGPKYSKNPNYSASETIHEPSEEGKFEYFEPPNGHETNFVDVEYEEVLI